MPRSKITVIGAGNVGASLAQQILAQRLGDVVLLDIDGDLARGKALDLNQSAPVLGYSGCVVGTSDYPDTAGSEIIVITSGSPRKPGMSRDDLLKINFEIVRAVAKQAAAVSPEAVIIVVTNPLDAMTYTALKVTGFPKHRVVGMAGILDSARFRHFIAEELKVSSQAVEAMVMGGHGDEMVPCLPLTRMAGVPVVNLLPPEKLDKIITRTRYGGGEIVKLLRSGSAYYAPAASAASMVAAVIRDEKAVLPCAAWLSGEYGHKDIVLGVPVMLGRRGVEQIVKIELDPKEEQALRRSAETVGELCRRIDDWL